MGAEQLLPQAEEEGGLLLKEEYGSVARHTGCYHRIPTINAADSPRKWLKVKPI